MAISRFLPPPNRRRRGDIRVLNQLIGLLSEGVIGVRPSKSVDLSGERFGLLTAYRQAGRTRTGQALWLCVCDCSRPTAVAAVNLVSGGSKSCGCQTRGNTGKPVKSLPVPPNIESAIRNMIKEYRWLESEMEKIPDPEAEDGGPLPEEMVPLFLQTEELDSWINHLTGYYNISHVHKTLIAEFDRGAKNEQCPTTDEFQDIMRHYADEKNCLDFAVELRWPNGIECPYCECQRFSFISTRNLWHCKGCKKRFSVKVGTIMEDSAVPLSKWVSAFCVVAETGGSISSCELARVLGVTQKTAWFMIHRIQQGLLSPPPEAEL